MYQIVDLLARVAIKHQRSSYITMPKVFIKVFFYYIAERC